MNEIDKIKQSMQVLAASSDRLAQWKEPLVARCEAEMASRLELGPEDARKLNKMLSHVCDLAFMEGVCFAIKIGDTE